MGMLDELKKEQARRQLSALKQEKASRANAMTGNPNIIEETHDDVSFADRAIVKNFSQNPEKSAKYLAKNNPQLDTRVWDGRVLVKSKGAKDWNALDPDTGAFSMDILGDVADVGYDVASGIGEGLAFTGGLAASPLGAIGASAATAAGSEALRQGIGSSLGIDNELGQAVQDVGISGAIGGAIPGVGKMIAPVAKKVTSKVLEKAPKYLSKIGNQSKGEMDTLVENIDELKRVDADGITPMVREVKEGTEDIITRATKEIGEQVDEIISNAPDVNIKQVKDNLKNRINELEGIANNSRTEANIANLNAAVDSYNKHFVELDETTGEVIGEIADVMNANDAWKLQQNLRGESKSFRTTDAGFQSTHGKADSVATKQTSNAFKDAEKDINVALDAVTDGGATEAKKLYAMQKSLEKDVAPVFKSAKTVEQSLRTLGSDSNKVKKEMLEYLDKNYGTNLIKTANKVKMVNTFGKGAEGAGGLNMEKISEQTPLSRLLGGAGGILGWQTGSGFGAVLGAGAGQAVGKKLSSPKALRAYIETAINSDKLVDKMTPEVKAWLKKELYKKMNRGDLIRESIKTSRKVNEER